MLFRGDGVSGGQSAKRGEGWWRSISRAFVSQAQVLDVLSDAAGDKAVSRNAEMSARLWTRIEFRGDVEFIDVRMKVHGGNAESRDRAENMASCVLHVLWLSISLPLGDIHKTQGPVP